MKILVSDFDGTLFTKDYKKNIKAINKFKKENNIFIIATGRNVSFLKKDIENYNINYDFLICNDGGVIVDKNDNIISISNIENAEEIKKLLETNYKEKVIIDDGFNYFEDKTINNNALMIKHNNEDFDHTYIEKLGLRSYRSPNWIRILPKNSDKKYAIEFIINKYGYNKEDVYTVGDQVNDILMNLEFKGYAIKGGNEELIKVSQEVVESVNDLIKKHLFDK